MIVNVTITVNFRKKQAKIDYSCEDANIFDGKNNYSETITLDDYFILEMNNDVENYLKQQINNFLLVEKVITYQIEIENVALQTSQVKKGKKYAKN